MGCEFCQKCCQIFQLMRLPCRVFVKKRNIKQVCMMTVRPKNIIVGNVKK